MCACNATLHSALEACLNCGVFIRPVAEMQTSAAAAAAAVVCAARRKENMLVLL